MHRSAYDRLQVRFGVATRQCVSLAFLITRFMADGVRIFAGAIPLALLTGWDAGWAIVLMGGVTLAYTLAGGLRAVVWTDVLQWSVYMLGSRPFTLLGGLVGGALMSAASHGTDHLIVQRLLATRSLRSARWALVGSGLLVTAQFALFLLLGTALWAAGAAPQGLAGDELLPRFVLQQLPSGLAGLLMAGILAAAMSTISSSISAMASSLTHDLYAPWAGLHPVHDAARLQRAGRWFSLLWGLLLIAAALGLHAAAPARDTPVVVLALSVASITYGALLGVYLLSSPRSGVQGPQVIAGALATVLLMTGLVLARPLSAWPPLAWLAPAGQLAFPWYVPLGTAITVAVAWLAARATRTARAPGRCRWYAAASPTRTSMTGRVSGARGCPRPIGASLIRLSARTSTARRRSRASRATAARSSPRSTACSRCRAARTPTSVCAGACARSRRPRIGSTSSGPARSRRRRISRSRRS